MGEFRGKQICQECFDQIQPELQKLLQEQVNDQPGPIITDDAQLKVLIGNIMNNYERHHTEEYWLKRLGNSHLDVSYS